MCRSARSWRSWDRLRFRANAATSQGHTAIAPFELKKSYGQPLPNVGATWNFDLSGQVKIADRFTLYADVLNAFDIKPVFDPVHPYL